MRLLVTRPEPEASSLKLVLEGRGHRVLVEPLMRIDLLPIDIGDLDGAQALIATSRNAVRALSTCPDLETLLDLPLFAVGPGTAASARALGFRLVVPGTGDAALLGEVIAETAEVNAGPLVHLSGDAKAGDLPGELRRLGFAVHEPVVYTTTIADRFSAPTLAAFERRAIDGVLLMSPRTARTYARLMLAHRLRDASRRVRHLCLSQAVARGLDAISAEHVAVAERPNLEEMLALVDRTAPLSP